MAELALGLSFTFTFEEVLTDGNFALHQRQLTGHDANAKVGHLLQPHWQLASLFVVLLPGAVDEPAVGMPTPRVLKIMAECILMAPAELPCLVCVRALALAALTALTHIMQEVAADVTTCGPGSRAVLPLTLIPLFTPQEMGEPSSLVSLVSDDMPAAAKCTLVVIPGNNAAHKLGC